MIKPYREEIRDTLQTGDILLFSGKGFVSGLIRAFCRLCKRRKSEYSHIGMVVVDAGRVMIFESTMLHGEKGVQLNALSDVLQVYKGKVFLRRLKCSRDGKFYEVIANAITELIGRPYEKNIVELMSSASQVASFIAGHKGSLSSIFCSELVAEVFIRLGFLPEMTSPSKYSPDEFAEGGAVAMMLQYSDKDVKLSAREQLK